MCAVNVQLTKMYIYVCVLYIYTHRDGASCLVTCTFLHTLHYLFKMCSIKIQITYDF